MKKYSLGLASLFALAALVLAATLVQEEEVISCTDTDSGLNFTVKGTIFGLNLTGGNYTFTDKCKANNITLHEGACFFDASSNKTFAQVWSQNCSDFNMTCTNGKCV